jgi:hypothetical protein
MRERGAMPDVRDRLVPLDGSHPAADGAARREENALVHTLPHPGRNTRQFVTIAAGLVAAAVIALVLVFTLSDPRGRGGAEAQPPRVEHRGVTAGERTAAHQSYLDRLQELNTSPQERAAGERTAADQSYLDRLQELNTGPQERAAGERTAAHQSYLDRLQELNTTP